jgi:hypothetical protein
MRAALAENSAEPMSMLDAIGNPESSPAQLYAYKNSNVNGLSEGNKSESSECTERNLSFDVACLTEKIGHEGPPEET